MKNHYAALGVNQNDSEEIIKRAYRKLAKKYHPDNDASAQAKEKMIEISEAWEILGNKKKRRQYDEYLSGKQTDKSKPFNSKKATAPEPSRPMTQEDFFNMTRSFDNMLSPEAIKNSAMASKNQKSAPIDSTTFFEKVMGIKL